MTRREKELEKLVAQQQKTIVQLTSSIEHLTEINRTLQLKVDALMKIAFGKKSEKLSPEEQLLLFGDNQLGEPETSSENEEKPDVAPEEEKSNAHKKKRKKRALKLPEDLPVVINKVVTPEEVLANPDDYEKIDEDYQDLLDMTPQVYFKSRTINEKYRLKNDKLAPPLQAPMPARPIPGAFCAPGFASHLAVSKYCDHLPQYRLQQILRTRFKIDIPRQKLNRWNTAIAHRLRCIYDAIKDEVLATSYLQADETPIHYLKPGSGQCQKGYLWILNAPQHQKTSVYYHWATGRSHKVLIDLLGDPKAQALAKTLLQCDGHKAYGTYSALCDEQITLGACLAHIRRKFFDARAHGPQPMGLIMRLISHLYNIERKLRDQRAGPNLRVAVRAAESKPIMARLKKIFTLLQPRYKPSSPITQALNYALNQWSKQEEYLKHGEMEIDNNLVENAVRPTKLGMKNWLFFGDKEAGWISALFYTLIENCKRNKLNPHHYLEEVLTHLPETPSKEDAASLTPCAMAQRMRQQKMRPSQKQTA